MAAKLQPLEKWRAAARTFNAGGDDLAWWTTGEGEEGGEEKPWLLLIHGFPSASWDWSAIWPALRERFNLLALDMLGFGLSDKPANRRYSFLDQADLQEALLAFVGLGEAHVLAHDYGDTVAQELLARHNERALSFNLKSCVFLNGGVFPDAQRPLAIQRLGAGPLGGLVARALTRERFTASLARVFGPQTPPTDEELAAWWDLLTENDGRRALPRIMRYLTERKRRRARWVGAIESARAPIAMINGGADPVSGAPTFERFRETAPNAPATLFETIGHYPHTEAPDETVAAFFAIHDAMETKSAMTV